MKSKLFSPSDIQSIVKKAIVERLKGVYSLQWFPETGAEYPIRISFMKDEAVVCLDTTGLSLHKRGYRTMVSKAPITGDAGSSSDLMLTPWNKDRILVDPFCGSGTFPDRGSHDGSQYCTGYEPFLLICRELDRILCKT